MHPGWMHPGWFQRCKFINCVFRLFASLTASTQSGGEPSVVLTTVAVVMMNLIAVEFDCGV